ncbi:hypothetical protein DM77_3440 [Burkholderia mallei]|nr:hypothetical protein DM77_3440 [Burkholderia mallei]
MSGRHPFSFVSFARGSIGLSGCVTQCRAGSV